MDASFFYTTDSREGFAKRMHVQQPAGAICHSAPLCIPFPDQRRSVRAEPVMDLLRYTRIPFRPRFYYGWAMAPIGMLSVMCTAPAQTFGIAVFLPYIRADLGLTPAQTATAYMIGTLLASLPLTGIGACMDRYGPRLTMTVIILCFSGACLLISQAVGLFSLLLAFLFLRMFGQGALTMMGANTLAYWFHRRLGIMHGFKSMGVAVTIAVAPALHYFLIRQFGWRTAYIGLGLSIACLLLPLMFFVYRSRPESVGQTLDQEPVIGSRKAPEESVPDQSWTFRTVLRTRAYWIFAGGAALWALVSTAAAFCSGSIFETRGLTATEAAALVSRMFAAMGATLFVAHVASGWLADRYPLRRLLSIALCVVATVGLLLGMPNSENHVYLIGIAMGLSQALMTAVSATVWVRYFGRAALGRIRGSTFTLLVAASSLGPFMVDGMAALTGDYTRVLFALALLPLPLAVAALWATPPSPPSS